MKKILVGTLLLTSLAGFASAAALGVLATNAVSPEGCAIYGGADAPTATASINPLVRLSTGVAGLVNFTVVATTTSPGYAIFTKQTNGSKVFGTSNDSTNIFWKASASKTPLTNGECGTVADITNFSTGWTSY